MIDPDRPGERRVDQRCRVLLRLAVVEGERGHPIEARDLLAAAECEARRGDRPDLLAEVRRACVRANRTPMRAAAALAVGASSLTNV